MNHSLKNYIGLAFAVGILTVLYRDKLELYCNKLLYHNKTNKSDKNIYTADELAQFDGLREKTLYLAILGSIFDVSKGIKHYGQGSPYNYFVGKDGSRAFITGNFKDESDNKDHILDFKCDELLALLNWNKTFTDKYVYMGVLNARYYNYNGEETEYMKQFAERITSCKKEKEELKKRESRYPPCNISWSAEEGTRVWCTNTSGGISRNWVGVPRQMYAPGDGKLRCVCVNTTKGSINTNSAGPQYMGLLKEYENCSSTANSCYIK